MKKETNPIPEIDVRIMYSLLEYLDIRLIEQDDETVTIGQDNDNNLTIRGYGDQLQEALKDYIDSLNRRIQQLENKEEDEYHKLCVDDTLDLPF